MSKKYELPPLAEFVKRKRGDITGENFFLSSVSESQFKFCLINFIQLLSDFSAGQPSHLEFRLASDSTMIPPLDRNIFNYRYRDNWSDQIILIYILLITATDKRIITNFRVRDAITTGIHCHLDSFRFNGS